MQSGGRSKMLASAKHRWRLSWRPYWREILLCLAISVPWISLIVLGSLWLWQNGWGLPWALGAAGLSMMAWPLLRAIRRRAREEAKAALAGLGEPSCDWNANEDKAWTAVLTLADSSAPLTFMETRPILAKMR